MKNGLNFESKTIWGVVIAVLLLIMLYGCGGSEGSRGGNNINDSNANGGKSTANNDSSSNGNVTVTEDKKINLDEFDIGMFNETIQSNIDGVNNQELVGILIRVEPYEGDYSHLIVCVADDCKYLTDTQKQEVADEVGQVVQAAAIGTYYTIEALDDRPMVDIYYETGGLMAETMLSDPRIMKVKD